MDIIPEIQKATIADKIYFHKDDTNLDTIRSEFTYLFNGEPISTLEDLGEGNYSLGIGTLSRLNIANKNDIRIAGPVLSNPLTFQKTLFKEQQEVVDGIFKWGPEINSGFLVAKCSWGKTFTGVNLVCRANVPTLILVHTKLLWNQWINEFKEQTGYEPGVIGDGIYNPKDITIGLYLSVNNNIEQLKNRSALVLVDECHRCPADLFSSVVNKLSAKYKVGMSATPKRRDGKHLLLPDYFGYNIVQAKEYRKVLVPTVDFVNSDFVFNPRTPNRDWAKALTTLYSNEDYLRAIAWKANKKIFNGRCPLILGARVEALKQLNKMIPGSQVLIGSTPADQRDKILANLGKSVTAVLSTTIFDEGISAHRLDTLILTEPSSNFIRLEQRIGRIQREHEDKQPPLIVDFLLRGMIVNKQQQTRYRWYKSLGFTINDII